jgi:hypothetical protein
MMFIDLTDENFLIYATKAYQRPTCLMSEFEDDLLRLKYIKRLFRKYRTKGVLKERLILNHLIILSNVFGPRACARICFYKMMEDGHIEDLKLLKSFLIFLNMMPEKVGKIRGLTIESQDIEIDNKILELLKTKI